MCTDVMGRGVDIPDVHWVLQYDPPGSARYFLLVVLSVKDLVFYNSAIAKPVLCARIVAEMGSHLVKRVPVKSHNSFLDQRSRKVIV